MYKRNAIWASVAVLFLMSGCGGSSDENSDYAGSYSDGIVTLHAAKNGLDNPVVVPFEAGSYTVQPIEDRFIAVNAWGGGVVSGCDDNGSNCTYGYYHRYSMSSDDINNYYGTTVNYKNEILAFEHAHPYDVTFDVDTNVSFFIVDTHYKDNIGGISLKIIKN